MYTWMLFRDNIMCVCVWVLKNQVNAQTKSVNFFSDYISVCLFTSLFSLSLFLFLASLSLLINIISSPFFHSYGYLKITSTKHRNNHQQNSRQFNQA